jgi:DNA-binding SARP family transcriptional activator
MPSESGPTFRVLGPLEVENSQAPLGGRKQRALLEFLLLHAGEPVGTGRLIEALWGDQPPPTAAAVVYAYIRKLRLVLLGTGASIETESNGYRLQMAAQELDACRFETLARDGRNALHADEPATAAQLLEEGLGLWRGSPFVDLENDPTVEGVRQRLDQVRLDVSRDRIDAELALGRHTELVSELRQLVADSPYDEGLRMRLMLALYRSGRQAEALDAYREARRILHTDLGLEPSEHLRQLERAILGQDAELAPPEASHGSRARRRPRRAHAAVFAVALLAAVAGAVAFVLVSSTGAKAIAVQPNSVAVIDATSGAVVADVRVGGDPTRVVAGERAVWVINDSDSTLTRIDPASLQARTIGLPAAPAGLAVGHAAVWVANGAAGSVTRIDVRSGVSETVSLGREIDEAHQSVPRFAGALAIGDRGVWAAEGARLATIAVTGGVPRPVATLETPAGPNALVVRNGVAWSLNRGVLTTLDLRRHEAASVQIGAALPDAFGGGPLSVGLAAGAEGVWSTNPFEGVVEEVSAQGTPLATVQVPGRPVAVATGHGKVWAAGLDGDLAIIDPDTATLLRTVHLGQPATSIALGYGRVWVTVAAG